jgi:hypothetical protein
MRLYQRLLLVAPAEVSPDLDQLGDRGEVPDLKLVLSEWHRATGPVSQGSGATCTGRPTSTKVPPATSYGALRAIVAFDLRPRGDRAGAGWGEGLRRIGSGHGPDRAERRGGRADPIQDG